MVLLSAPARVGEQGMIQTDFLLPRVSRLGLAAEWISPSWGSIDGPSLGSPPFAEPREVFVASRPDCPSWAEIWTPIRYSYRSSAH